MNRWPLIISLAWHDYRGEARLSACAVLALVAVLAPLLVLFGLKFGLVGSLTERLQQDPTVREVIPLGGGRYSAAYINELSRRPDVAFALPRTRQIAATAEVTVPGTDGSLNLEMIPSAAGDPLLGSLPAPVGFDRVLLSESAAQRLNAKAGDRLQASISRQVAGRIESRQLSIQVQGVLPAAAFNRDGLFASLGLLEAAEDYRDGRAVAALGWPGAEGATAERVYPAFRLYARDLDGVQSLQRYFIDAHQQVATQAAAIAQVRALSRNLSVVFWIIAGLALGGAFAAVLANALASVQRKQRVLAVLRLLGLSSLALLVFLVCQACFSGVFASLLAWLVYRLAELLLNQLFTQDASQYACRLLLQHYLLALFVTLACCGLAAALGGWRARHIEVSEGLRDV